MRKLCNVIKLSMNAEWHAPAGRLVRAMNMQLRTAAITSPDNYSAINATIKPINVQIKYVPYLNTIFDCKLLVYTLCQFFQIFVEIPHTFLCDRFYCCRCCALFGGERRRPAVPGIKSSLETKVRSHRDLIAYKSVDNGLLWTAASSRTAPVRSQFFEKIIHFGNVWFFI